MTKTRWLLAIAMIFLPTTSFAAGRKEPGPLESLRPLFERALVPGLEQNPGGISLGENDFITAITRQPGVSDLVYLNKTGDVRWYKDPALISKSFGQFNVQTRPPTDAIAQAWLTKKSVARPVPNQGVQQVAMPLMSQGEIIALVSMRATDDTLRSLIDLASKLHPNDSRSSQRLDGTKTEPPPRHGLTDAGEIPKNPSADDIRAIVASPNFNDYAGLTTVISKQPDWMFRVFAYQYIGEKEKLEALGPFLAIYPAETQPLVKGVLLAQLGHFAEMRKRLPNWKGVGSPFEPILSAEERERIFQLANQESDAFKPQPIRQAAISIIGQFARPESADLLAKATTDPSPAISATALAVIRFQNSTQSRDFWLRQLKDGTPTLKGYAINAVGGLEDPGIDKILEDAARDDPTLADAVKKELEWRENRRKSQEGLERALHPTPLDKILSIVTKAAWTGGLYAVFVLIIPCAIAAVWAKKNTEFETLIASASFLIALCCDAIARMAFRPHPGMELSVVLMGVIALCLPVLIRVCTLSTKTILFDSSIILGFLAIVMSGVKHSMAFFFYAGMVFGVSILLGSAQSIIYFRRQRFAEAAHCVAYASVIAMLLRCLPFAFIGM